MRAGRSETAHAWQQMSWLLSVDDVRRLRAVFGDVSVVSSRVDLHEIGVDRDGPELHLRFDLLEFPSDPPPKWLAMKANTVQVTLSIVGLTKLAIAGIEADMRGIVRVERNASAGNVAVSFDAGDVHLYAEGTYSAISAMSAYWNGDTQETVE